MINSVACSSNAQQKRFLDDSNSQAEFAKHSRHKHLDLLAEKQLVMGSDTQTESQMTGQQLPPSGKHPRTNR
jgi:hypothetical protein